MTDYLWLARQAIREREQRLAADGEQFIDRAASLKGHAVELWRAGERFFIVCDESDARAVVERGIGSRGEVWTATEIERVATISDQSARDEVERWKRRFDGRLGEAEDAD